MSFEKPSLREEYIKGDIRNVLYLIKKYTYTDEEASEVINVHEPYENNYIPEVENMSLLHHFPNSTVSEATLNAVKNCYPDTYNYIIKNYINKK